MIIVTGDIVARPGCFEALLRASVDHVHRSRAEAGCISHDVHVDCENPLRLVFVERWSDQAALRRHFEQPGSVRFVAAIKGLVAARPGLQVYQAAELPTQPPAS